MDARKERKVLTKKLLEEAVQNLDDLSDLSGSDSEDDSCFINSIHSPSDSYLNQIDDNLIEQRLEHIFGFGLTGDEQEPPTPPMQTQQMSTDALLTVLDETSHFTNTPKTDNRLLPTHLGTETEQCYDQPSDVHTFNEVQQHFDVIDVPMEEFLANDGQESETNNEVRRDRSQPRVWEIKSETHEVPLFEKRFKPKANDTHKTSPLTIKWLDTKEVTVLTTAHQPLDTRIIKRTQKDGSRADILYPAAIASYTLSMGGVDLFDHFRSSYPIIRKSRKYWMRLFFFLFDASIINAYITYNYSHVPTLHGHRDFRLRFFFLINLTMPLSGAERQKRYREKLKLERPQEYENQRKKNLEKIKSKKKKNSELTPEEAEQRREEWRKNKRTSRQKQKRNKENSTEGFEGLSQNVKGNNELETEKSLDDIPKEVMNDPKIEAAHESSLNFASEIFEGLINVEEPFDLNSIDINNLTFTFEENDDNIHRGKLDTEDSWQLTTLENQQVTTSSCAQKGLLGSNGA
ncbi:hypothetical protein HW555_013630, partial [Spodoptera exigua]